MPRHTRKKPIRTPIFYPTWLGLSARRKKFNVLIGRSRARSSIIGFYKF